MKWPRQPHSVGSAKVRPGPEQSGQARQAPTRAGYGVMPEASKNQHHRPTKTRAVNPSVQPEPRPGPDKVTTMTIDQLGPAKASQSQSGPGQPELEFAIPVIARVSEAPPW